MSYAEKFIKSQGQDCVIDRTPLFPTKISIKRSTKASRDLGIREGYWEGLILADSNLKSGETITIRDTKYLIQSTNYDSASTQIAFFSAKCNAIIQHRRYIEDVDENFNPIQEWQDVNPDKPNIACYGEVITSRMRETEIGLEDNAVYIFQIPKSLGVAMQDRFVYGKNYQVVSIDDIGLEGVARIQLGMDNRPD